MSSQLVRFIRVSDKSLEDAKASDENSPRLHGSHYLPSLRHQITNDSTASKDPIAQMEKAGYPMGFNINDWGATHTIRDSLIDIPKKKTHRSGIPFLKSEVGVASWTFRLHGLDANGDDAEEP
ncbi:uncharacterized protein N7515_002583 [Penicillium bovifimosum]|uniref:Uncharacterized protein n=1 Tax=Penicillium bovifimosum TaxID=126998 RepID=A0A9W9HDP1_9EURO|nr:uncharacterized protein N7515_002583 [Penicillium bovifimosum]KAJ5143796.1 hypothetical protein N7515_002583 [Penicillium bovifimosum]